MRFRLEEWEIDTAQGVVRGGGEVRRPEPTAMRLLEALARHHGEPVAREQLIAEVWEGRHVTQGALTVAMCGLRKALGDDPRRPRFVRTHSGRGYSLLACPVPPAARRGSGRWLEIAALLGSLLAVLGAMGTHHH